MATATITLYTQCEIVKGRNFVVEDIENYLATLSATVINNYQYQRFDLKKTIKIDLNQNWQTKEDNLQYEEQTISKKWNYLKISTLVNNNNVNYYYFIIGYKQLSPQTIELSIEMDSINTFKYSTIYNNDTYTLSNKTLVTREHKDRFGGIKIVGGQAATIENRNVWKGKQLLMTTKDLYIGGDGYRIYQFGLMSSGQISVPLPYKIYVYDKTNFTLKDTLTNNNGFLQVGISSYRPGEIYFKIVGLSSTSYFYDKEDYIFIEFSNAVGDYVYIGSRIELSKFLTDYVVKINDVVRIRKIYPFQEGIETITFKTEEHSLLDEDNYSTWYVAYSSADNEAVKVDFIKDNGYTVVASSKKIVKISPSDIPQYSNQNEWLKVNLTQLETDGYVEINGVQYVSTGYVQGGITYTQLWIEKKNNNDAQFRRVSVNGSSSGTFIENVSAVYFYGLNDCELYTGINDIATDYRGIFTIGSGTSTMTGTSPSFESFDLTDPKLIKVINYPYSPRSDIVGNYFDNISNDLVWNNSLNCLELKKAQDNKFNRDITFNYSPFKELGLSYLEFSGITPRDERDIKFESKLFHSDYYLPKFVYDSFSFGFRLEDMDEEAVGEFFNFDTTTVQYVCSGNVQSKFAFIFNDYVCKREIQDYNNVLVIERNNEKALYNNAYIQYLRAGGFTYDTKNADSQKLVNGLMIALSTLGATASFVGGVVTGNTALIGGGIALAIGTATKTISAIHSAQQNDRAVSQKLLSASQQGTNVSTSEDIDILKAYSNNKAKLCYYSISDILKNALWDLFHYFGYRCNEYKIPEINTRCNFNFIQAQIEYKEYNFNDDIAQDIKEKWSTGITFLHNFNNTWDFNQRYENWEVSLI